MADKSDKFRDQLFHAQEMTPALREAYEKEVDAMFNEPLSWRKSAVGVGLLVVLVVCVVGIVRTMLVYSPGPLLTVGWGVLAAVFSWASYLIVRDLRRGKHSHKSVHSIAGGLTLAAGTLTVVALILGLKAPNDPSSTFNAFYVFVFYFACIAWALENQIAAAELASKEQLLRIECRLAELAERLG